MMIEQDIRIGGMTCQACTKLTGNRIRKITGVVEVTVSLESQIAHIVSQRAISAHDVQTVLKDTDYTVKE